MRIEASLLSLALTALLAGCAAAQQGASDARPGAAAGSYQNPAPPAARLGVALTTSGGARPIVSAVEPGSPAATAGFRPGDEVLSVDGRDSLEPPLFPGLAPGREYRVRVRRGTVEHDLVLTAAPPR